jgi:hypothetical protein
LILTNPAFLCSTNLPTIKYKLASNETPQTRASIEEEAIFAALRYQNEFFLAFIYIY